GKGGSAVAVISSRPTLPVVLGTAALVWHHSCQWLHLTALCARALLAPPAAVGRSSATPIAYLWIFARALRECLSLCAAPCVLQCRVFWSHSATIDFIAEGGPDYTVAGDNL